MDRNTRPGWLPPPPDPRDTEIARLRVERDIMRELVERAVGRICSLDGPESMAWLDDARRALDVENGR